MVGGILSRKQILSRIQSDQMITNIQPSKDGIISTGDTICGYDVTLGHDFTSISTSGVTNNPKYDGMNVFGSVHRSGPFTMGPGEILIGETMEEFKIPLDLIVTSTLRGVYNSFGVILNMSPLLPGYTGKARFQIANLSKNGIMLHPGEGMMTLQFFTISMADGEQGEAYTGKYNNQDGIVVIPPVR